MDIPHNSAYQTNLSVWIFHEIGFIPSSAKVAFASKVISSETGLPHWLGYYFAAGPKSVKHCAPIPAEQSGF